MPRAPAVRHAEGRDEPRRPHRRRAGRAHGADLRGGEPSRAAAAAPKSTRWRSAPKRVLIDDPLLTARDVYRWRPLTRVIFDRRLRTPPTARIFTTRAAGPILIVTSTASPCRRSRAGRPAAARARRRGRDDRHDGSAARPDERDDAALRGLAASAPLLLEGGAALHAARVERGARRSRADVRHAACARAGRRAVGNAIVVRLDDAARHAE